MRGASFLFLMCAVGCASAPRVRPPESARELGRDGRATFEDDDVRAELAVDRSRALVVTLANKTDAPLDVAWDEVCVIGPDHVATPFVDAARAAPSLSPGARVAVRLPIMVSRGRHASALELVLPTVVRGVAREYHYHVRAPLDGRWLRDRPPAG